jgi:hypothetical protein
LATGKRRGRPSGSTDSETDQRAWLVLILHLTGDTVRAASRKAAAVRQFAGRLAAVSASAARKAYQRRREAWGSRVTASRETGVVVTAALDPSYTAETPPPSCRCGDDDLPHLHCRRCNERLPPLLTRCPRCQQALTGSSR